MRIKLWQKQQKPGTDPGRSNPPLHLLLRLGTGPRYRSLFHPGLRRGPELTSTRAALSHTQTQTGTLNRPDRAPFFARSARAGRFRADKMPGRLTWTAGQAWVGKCGSGREKRYQNKAEILHRGNGGTSTRPGTLGYFHFFSGLCRQWPRCQCKSIGSVEASRLRCQWAKVGADPKIKNTVEGRTTSPLLHLLFCPSSVV